MRQIQLPSNRFLLTLAIEKYNKSRMLGD